MDKNTRKAIREIEQQMINAAIGRIKSDAWSYRSYGDSPRRGDIGHLWLEQLDKRNPKALHDPETSKQTWAYINETYRTGFDQSGNPRYNASALLDEDTMEAIKTLLAHHWTIRLENQSGIGYWCIYRQAGYPKREKHAYRADDEGYIRLPTEILDQLASTGYPLAYNRGEKCIYVTIQTAPARTEKRYIGKSLNMAAVRKKLEDEIDDNVLV